MMLRSSPRRRQGQVVVLTSVAMTAVLGVVAVSLDGGTLLTQRRQAQLTADAAALSAASDLYYNYWVESGWDTSGTAKAAALKVAADNGYTNDGVESVVNVYIPPISGDYIGRPGYVEVVVQYNQRRSFSNIFARGAIPVQARAVAVGAPIAGDVGILVLDPASKGALVAGGGGNTIVDGTPVVNNSAHPEGSIANGGGYLQALEFDLTGGYTTTGGGQFVGPIYTNRRPMEDPLLYLPEPDRNTLPVQSTKKIQYTSGETTLSPGVYKGGISVSGTGSLILEPGIYVMDGGGFSFSGQGNLRGEGVMIYNDPGNGNSDAISVTGQGSVYLTPMMEGIYAGLTFWQRR
ncbi:MAG TPA: pilus assembly protein TadG-related protein, partial [Gemmataceae bacterium]